MFFDRIFQNFEAIGDKRSCFISTDTSCSDFHLFSLNYGVRYDKVCLKRNHRFATFGLEVTALWIKCGKDDGVPNSMIREKYFSRKFQRSCFPKRYNNHDYSDVLQVMRKSQRLTEELISGSSSDEITSLTNVCNCARYSIWKYWKILRFHDDEIMKSERFWNVDWEFKEKLHVTDSFIASRCSISYPVWPLGCAKLSSWFYSLYGNMINMKAGLGYPRR